jgi:hypothetical protein
MATLTTQEAREFLERWKLVHDEQAAQLRDTSMDVKLQQLAALMASRDAFAQDPNREREILEVRERWAQLRRALGG